LGQVKMNETVNHDGGTRLKKLQLITAAKGNYTMEIVRPDNTKTAIHFLNQ